MVFGVHPRTAAIRRVFLALLVFVLLSPTLGGLALRAGGSGFDDFTDPRYLCTHDLSAAMADLAGAAPAPGDSERVPPFQDPSCSLCLVLARAVFPEPTLTAPMPAATRSETLRRIDPEVSVLTRRTLPPRARAPPQLI
ncbi:MAG: hypothetical protein Q8Q63_01640 [Phaeovulum sp.]|uniref:DUF2946 family protein n=1 Tax=Phaeovulum sp. TaxID=2934796 RepID=UPI0027354CFD|nr:DUF2946 family protein [Phaeovulum sp.]MDP3860269.1 hypothetical protein [Phaeovulum sp.]